MSASPARAARAKARSGSGGASCGSPFFRAARGLFLPPRRPRPPRRGTVCGGLRLALHGLGDRAGFLGLAAEGGRVFLSSRQARAQGVARLEPRLELRATPLRSRDLGIAARGTGAPMRGPPGPPLSRRGSLSVRRPPAEAPRAGPASPVRGPQRRPGTEAPFPPGGPSLVSPTPRGGQRSARSLVGTARAAPARSRVVAGGGPRATPQPRHSERSSQFPVSPARGARPQGRCLRVRGAPPAGPGPGLAPAPPACRWPSRFRPRPIIDSRGAGGQLPWWATRAAAAVARRGPSRGSRGSRRPEAARRRARAWARAARSRRCQ